MPRPDTRKDVMSRRKPVRDLLIRINVQLSVDDIEYLESHWESRSTAIRQLIRDHRLKDTSTAYNMESVFNAYAESLNEALAFAAADGREIDHIVPSFGGFCEKMYQSRPQKQVIFEFLQEKLNVLYPPE